MVRQSTLSAHQLIADMLAEHENVCNAPIGKILPVGHHHSPCVADGRGRHTAQRLPGNSADDRGTSATAHHVIPGRIDEHKITRLDELLPWGYAVKAA